MDGSTLAELVRDRGASMDDILSTKHAVETELREIERKLDHYFKWADKEPLIDRKREISGIPYALQEFLALHDDKKVVLEKRGIPTFGWDSDKWCDGSGQRQGGFVYAGKYLGGNFYSLWADTPARFESLVYLKQDGKFYHLCTKNKKNPFTLIEDSMRTNSRVSSLFERNRESSEKVLFPIQDGDICTSKGVVVLGENADYAHILFDKVKSGVEIFPDPTEPRGYMIPSEHKKIRAEEKSIVSPRTFGQEFLNLLQPEHVIEGELFGSGHSYQAFVFGNRVVVESNEDAHATYFLSRGRFDALRRKSRRELLTEQPEGFLGRAIHPSQDQDSWKDCVTHYVREG